MLQNATLLRKSAPGPPNSSDEHVFCTAPATQMHLCRPSSNVPRLTSFLEMLQNPHILLTFDNVHNPLRLPRKTTSERPKVLRTPQCFCTFDLKMCFAPQRRALFFDISTSKSRHLNFQKWSEREMSLAFLLALVLRATTACTFSTSQRPKVLRTWDVFSLFTCKCASRHNGMQFFIHHLATWLHTPALASLLFDPPEPQIIGKTQCFATFLPFCALGSSFFWAFLFFDILSSSLLFSSLTLPVSVFYLSILSEIWLLNFLRSWYICHKRPKTSVSHWCFLSHGGSPRHHGGTHPQEQSCDAPKCTWRV